MIKKLGKKHFLIVYTITSVLAFVALFYLISNFIYTEKQPSVVLDPYQVELAGEYVCLPHKDTTGPQTDECAFGLKTDDGAYYAVDLSSVSQEGIYFMVGNRITANGIVTPIERLSTNQWVKYRIDGIFVVTDSLQVQE